MKRPLLLTGFIWPFLLLPVSAGEGEFKTPLNLDSGWLVNRSVEGAVLYRETITVPNATWLRLNLAGTVLADGMWLRLTSLQDGEQQVLDAVGLQQWGRSSAYFNGNRVLLELSANGDSGYGRLRVRGAGLEYEAETRTLCGDDDRLPLDDPRIGRLLPLGCTAWLIDDANGGMLTAGHCAGLFDVVQFNVPPSTADGRLVHPSPRDQYAIDPDSLQASDRLAGNDWAYFGCFPNPLTGLTPREAQGDLFTLNREPQPGSVRLAGYGTHDRQEWNRSLTYDAGGLMNISNHVLSYRVDTTEGNSGSPVIDEASGTAIGIHNIGYCDKEQVNQGTSLSQDALLAALADPKGVTRPKLIFELVEDLPEFLNAGRASLLVSVTGRDGHLPQPESGRLHVDVGGGFSDLSMQETEPGLYRADFPTLPCGADIRFGFSALTEAGDRVYSLTFTRDGYYHLPAAAGLTTVFSDNFETDRQWTVSNSANLTSGAWQRGAPLGGGSRGIPAFDGDYSGQCFLTDNTDPYRDVDEGVTSLISPVIDASYSKAGLSYARWFAVQSADEGIDAMTVWISDDAGETWNLLEHVPASRKRSAGGWVRKSFKIADYVTPGPFLRLRFDVTDLGNSSIVEAALDDVRITETVTGYFCYSTCRADLDVSNEVDENDLRAMAAWWGLNHGQDKRADMTGDDRIDIHDLLHVMDDYGICDPALQSGN
ncbi:MAG: hypothetical protein QNK37_24685 [Acidobacteriota bacterium]|nr:hypothetical protein [Acidobacteriota bacterium]